MSVYEKIEAMKRHELWGIQDAEVRNVVAVRWYNPCAIEPDKSVVYSPGDVVTIDEPRPEGAMVHISGQPQMFADWRHLFAMFA